MVTFSGLSLIPRYLLAQSQKWIHHDLNAHLRHSETSMMELSCENNEWLIAVNYFRKALSLMYDSVLHTPLSFNVIFDYQVSLSVSF